MSGGISALTPVWFWRCSATLTLPMLNGRAGIERVQAAVVFFASGNLNRLGRMADLACADWRDALVAAGLENEDWRDRLDTELGSQPGS